MSSIKIIFSTQNFLSVAVVVTFFLCWAPFHAQRIMAVYGKIMKKSFRSDDLFMRVYIVLTYISGISYFLSTCINPFLYNIMSHKFRNASKVRRFSSPYRRAYERQAGLRNTTGNGKDQLLRTRLITNRIGSNVPIHRRFDISEPFNK